MSSEPSDEWILSGPDYKVPFYDTWWSNTLKNSAPCEVVVINSASPHTPSNKRGTWVDLKTNLGHVHDLDRESLPLQFGAWSMSFLMGAMFAYNNRSDLIIKGQSCLTFGPWIDALYEQLNDQDTMMLAGATQANAYGVEQGLMILRHQFIMPFITALTAIPNPDGGHSSKIQPENKFLIIFNGPLGKHIRPLSFGYGKMRPLNYSDPVYYAQRVGPAELSEFRARGLVE